MRSSSSSSPLPSDSDTDIELSNQRTIQAVVVSLENPEEESLLESTADDYHKKIIALSMQVGIGAVRDVIWGMLTYRNFDFFNGKIGSFGGTTITQTIATPLLPAFAASMLLAQFAPALGCSNRTHLLLKEFAVYTVASWSSMPIWDAAQFGGIKLGEKIGLNATNAGYFSGVFCGIAETIAQGACVMPYFLNQPIEPISVALNTLGGAVWQWLYQANLPVVDQNSNEGEDVNMEAFFVGLRIATGVAAATMVATMTAWQLKKYWKHNKGSEQSTAPSEATGLITRAGCCGFFSRYSQPANALHLQEEVAPASSCGLQ